MSLGQRRQPQEDRVVVKSRLPGLNLGSTTSSCT